MYSVCGDWGRPQPGFPIRRSADHSLFGSFPRHIAAFHVLHRQQTPRHPPLSPLSLNLVVRFFVLLPLESGGRLKKRTEDPNRSSVTSRPRRKIVICRFPKTEVVGLWALDFGQSKLPRSSEFSVESSFDLRHPLHLSKSTNRESGRGWMRRFSAAGQRDARLLDIG